MEKTFIAADDLLTDSFRLAAKIAEDDFRPDFLVGLWRGGSAVGIAVQEGLEQFGIPTDHIAVRTSYRGAASYADMVSRADQIRVHGLEYLVDNVSSRHKMLIVDDVYSTGSSVAAVIQHLSRKTRRNLPGKIRTASVWFRETERTLQAPDYCIHKTSNWLVLPYELSGLSIDELRSHRADLGDIIDRLERLTEQRSR